MIKHASWPFVVPLNRVAPNSVAPSGVVLGVVMLSAMAACTSPAADPPAAVGLDEAEKGARIYAANCAACHGQDARGITGVYPSLVGSPVLLGAPKALSLWVARGQRPPSMPAGRYRAVMTRFGWLKPADAAAIFTYLRSHFGNAAPAVDLKTVAEALRP